MSLALLRIETRRNLGLWVWPLPMALAFLFAYGTGLSWKTTLWVQASVLVRDGLVIVGPAVAGLAAWMGGRERRRRMDDLLATTPRPAWARWGTTWAATALWGTLAYIVVSGYILILATRQTTWGVPTVWPMLVGLVAVPAYGAVGYALGRLFSQRFTAPLTTIALFALPLLVGYSVGRFKFGPAVYPASLDALHYLSPIARFDNSVWYGVRPNVGWPQTLFLLGLTALTLGGLALRDQRSHAGWSAFLGGGVLGGLAVAMLLVTAPPSASALTTARVYSAPSVVAPTHGTEPYTPVCMGVPIPVCVHPAYQTRLAAEAEVINRLFAPLVGLPTVPTRVAQTVAGDKMIVGQTVGFAPDSGDSATDQFFFGPIAQALVGGILYDERGPLSDVCPGDPTLQSCMDAQEAIGIWLVHQAGLHLSTVGSGQTMIHPFFAGTDWARTSAAADRFGRLGQSRQHAWLRAHYTALIQGHIRLRDIP